MAQEDSEPYVEGKSKGELVRELRGTAEPGSEVHEQMKMAIIAYSAADIEESVDELRHAIDQASQSANRLSAAVTILYAIIAVATVAGAILSWWSRSGVS